MTRESARARVENDFMRDGVAIHVSPRQGQVVNFGAVTVTHYDPASATDVNAEPLRIDDDMARAMYEALAEHYGHAGHDTRALRRDYDAERARVDKLIDAAMRRTP